MVFVACCLGLVAPAPAEDLEFLVTWSVEGFGNGASATAVIAIDDEVSQRWVCAPTIDDLVSSDGTTGCLLETNAAAVADLLAAEYGF